MENRYEQESMFENDQPEVRYGVIAGVEGHPMSGLWMLVFEDGTGVPISSGTGVRALACAFGAREGTGDLLSKIVGQGIYYSMDEFGLEMAGFTPEEEWEDR